MGNRLFCSYCGRESAPDADVCFGCGRELRKGKNFCTHCGAQTQSGQAVCLQCGCQLKNYYGERNRLAAGILAILLGGFGVHKFYLGKIGVGIVYLLCSTIGCLLILPPFIIWVISLVEGIIYFCMSDEEFNVKYN